MLCPREHGTVVTRQRTLYTEWGRYTVKLKLTLEQATKAQKGRRGIALLFL